MDFSSFILFSFLFIFAPLPPPLPCYFHSLRVETIKQTRNFYTEQWNNEYALENLKIELYFSFPFLFFYFLVGDSFY